MVFNIRYFGFFWIFATERSIVTQVTEITLFSLVKDRYFKYFAKKVGYTGYTNIKKVITYKLN